MQSYVLSSLQINKACSSIIFFSKDNDTHSIFLGYITTYDILPNIMLTTRGHLKGYKTLGKGSFYSPFNILNISDKYVTSKLSFQS